jgi:hypothetical protein
MMANSSRNMLWIVLCDKVLWSFRFYKLWLWEHVAREMAILKQNTDYETLCLLSSLFVWCLQVWPVLSFQDPVHLRRSAELISESDSVTLWWWWPWKWRSAGGIYSLTWALNQGERGPGILYIPIFSLLSLFWKNRVGLWDHVAVYACVCICLCILPIVARQRLGRNITAVMNTHATIEELLEALFSVWPVSYQGK